MEFHHQISISLNLFLVVFMGFSYSSQSHTFYVGGKDGWVANPSENYNHWAERSRFQVNDTLIFKYKKGLDSVLEVNRDDYYTCKKQNPLKTIKDGESEFKFDRSGPFYFISGYSLNCEKGQKLLVVVMFPRAHHASPHKAPSPSPSPSPKPVAHPAKPPSFHSPSPLSPTPSPSKNPPPVSPSHPTQSPTPTLAPAPAPAPAPQHVSVQHHDHHAPAPAHSAASVTGGGLNIVSLLSSLTVTMVSMMMMIMSW